MIIIERVLFSPSAKGPQFSWGIETLPWPGTGDSEPGWWYTRRNYSCHISGVQQQALCGQLWWLQGSPVLWGERGLVVIMLLMVVFTAFNFLIVHVLHCALIPRRLNCNTVHGEVQYAHCTWWSAYAHCTWWSAYAHRTLFTVCLYIHTGHEWQTGGWADISWSQHREWGWASTTGRGGPGPTHTAQVQETGHTTKHSLHWGLLHQGRIQGYWHHSVSQGQPLCIG